MSVSGGERCSVSVLAVTESRLNHSSILVRSIERQCYVSHASFFLNDVASVSDIELGEWFRQSDSIGSAS